MDTNYINDIMSTIKRETQKIKLFPIVINGETRLSQKSTIDTIQLFEEMFGCAFWRHACVVVTHWSESPDA
jgi:hypothetical protein